MCVACCLNSTKLNEFWFWALGPIICFINTATGKADDLDKENEKNINQKNTLNEKQEMISNSVNLIHCEPFFYHSLSACYSPRCQTLFSIQSFVVLDALSFWFMTTVDRETVLSHCEMNLWLDFGFDYSRREKNGGRISRVLWIIQRNITKHLHLFRHSMILECCCCWR